MCGPIREVAVCRAADRHISAAYTVDSFRPSSEVYGFTRQTTTSVASYWTHSSGCRTSLTGSDSRHRDRKSCSAYRSGNNPVGNSGASESSTGGQRGAPERTTPRKRQRRRMAVDRHHPPKRVWMAAGGVHRQSCAVPVEIGGGTSRSSKYSPRKRLPKISC